METALAPRVVDEHLYCWKNQKREGAPNIQRAQVWEVFVDGESTGIVARRPLVWSGEKWVRSEGGHWALGTTSGYLGISAIRFATRKDLVAYVLTRWKQDRCAELHKSAQRYYEKWLLNELGD